MNEDSRPNSKRDLGALEAFRIPIMIVLGLVVLVLMRERPLWPGMLVATFGELIQLWAASQLKKAKELATSGPYAHVRNPMYFGRFFVGLGILIMTHNVWLIVAYLLYYAFYVTGRVSREEARLAGIFGQDYADYCSEVRRFLPRLRPYRKSAGIRAQWSGIVRNHEYRNVVALLVYSALACARVQHDAYLAARFPGLF